MANADRFAARVFMVAGVYGLLVLLPQYFMEGRIGVTAPPPITHAEYFYGFVGVAVAWQVAFLMIARDPRRFHALMPVAVLEKLTFGLPVIVLFQQGRINAQMLGAGLLDLTLGAFFLTAWLRMRPETAERA
jgi:hypothetical protein